MSARIIPEGAWSRKNTGLAPRERRDIYVDSGDRIKVHAPFDGINLNKKRVRLEVADRPPLLQDSPCWRAGSAGRVRGTWGITRARGNF